MDINTIDFPNAEWATVFCDQKVNSDFLRGNFVFLFEKKAIYIFSSLKRNDKYIYI